MVNVMVPLNHMSIFDIRWANNARHMVLRSEYVQLQHGAIAHSDTSPLSKILEPARFNEAWISAKIQLTTR
jgi:hypothetical protein